MQFNWQKIISSVMLSSALIFSLSACQSFKPKAQGLTKPKAQGLTSSQWLAQDYQRQDQVEVQWKERSFSFLLYQQQQGQELELVALTLTGQQLFEIKFDGKNVKVEQRIEPMKLLPFDFVVRDILFATYPKFSELSPENVTVEFDRNSNTQNILIQQQKVLKIQNLTDHIELDNLQVPYKMIFSQVKDSLENDTAQNTILKSNP